MPEVGYQEVYLSRSLSRLDHAVRVFTSNKHSPSVKQLDLPDYRSGIQTEPLHKYEINRLKPLLKSGANIIAKRLRKEVIDFNPDLVIVVGVGKMFPYPLLVERKRRNYKLAALLGDNSDFYHWSSLKAMLNSVKSIIIQHVFKTRIYVKAVKSCDKLFIYTPETQNIILSYLPAAMKTAFKAKSVLYALGFDPNEFYFDSYKRIIVRNMLKISDNECVLVTSTRIKSFKRLERIIDLVSEMHSQNIRVRYILIGFLGDDYEKELKAYINKQPAPEIFHCFSFSKHDEVCDLFCAADIGIWLNAAISIQEAMGTGLPVILENKPSVNHLVQEGENGWYFHRGELPLVIRNTVSEVASWDVEHRIKHRKHIAQINSERLSYDKIASCIIAELQK